MRKTHRTMIPNEHAAGKRRAVEALSSRRSQLPPLAEMSGQTKSLKKQGRQVSHKRRAVEELSSRRSHLPPHAEKRVQQKRFSQTRQTAISANGAWLRSYPPTAAKHANRTHNRIQKTKPHQWLLALVQGSVDYAGTASE